MCDTYVELWCVDGGDGGGGTLTLVLPHAPRVPAAAVCCFGTETAN